MTKNSPDLDFFIDTAEQAGKILMRFFGTELTRHIKRNEDDFATEADLAAEKFIISQIQKEYPDDSIIAEESGSIEFQDSEYVWTIDPLDGTWNFAHHKDNFGTMISRSDQQGVELSVIYNPAKDLLAYAQRGRGAFLNGKLVNRRFPSSIKRTRPIAGWINDFSGHEKVSKTSVYLTSLGLRPQSLRSCAANTLAILNNQRDLYFSNVAQPWDICPMIPLLTEAGMLVTDLNNQSITYNNLGQGFLAASPDLHSQILELVNTIK